MSTRAFLLAAGEELRRLGVHQAGRIRHLLLPFRRQRAELEEAFNGESARQTIFEARRLISGGR